MHTALSEIFGFRSFRPHQEEIVRAILDNQDVFAVMPTGGGKSLCSMFRRTRRPARAERVV